MSVQIILKNSNVEDKRPLSTQLANGELSLNYSDAGAFLCCVDSAGNIQQVGGVKISDDAPAGPVRGTMWINSTNNNFFVYDGDTWLLLAGDGGGGGGGGGVTSVLGGDGILTTANNGVVTVSADIDADRGLHFVNGEIAVNIGANLSFDGQGRLRVDVDALSYKGTVDLTSATVPANPSQGDTFANTVTGTISAEWSAATGEGATADMVAGDLVAFNGTDWTYIPTGGNPGGGGATDLGVDDITATTLDITSSTGNDATVPAATDASAGLMTAADKAKLDGVADDAQANVQADWLEQDDTSDAFIHNKPAIVEQVQSDWDEIDELEPSFIRNKPAIVEQVQSDWDETDVNAVNFIQNKPTIPDAQVQSDWDETDTNAASFIQNKPDILEDAPSDGEQYARQDGAWSIVTGGGGEASVTISDTPPADPAEGDLWWNSDDGRLYIWYIDATSSQWVDASPDAGALTPGTTPPGNPNNGDIWVDLSQCPPVLNIWSDCSGTGEWNPAGGGALTAPEINNVTLGDSQGGAGRFTGATFQVDGNMTQEGSPESDRRLRIVITEDGVFRNPGLRAITRPVTAEITNVVNIDFADDIKMISSSENSWNFIRWVGQPFNRFIAVANAGSNTFKTMWSFNGEEWFQFTMGGLGLSSQPQFFYRNTNQRIYVSNGGRDTVFNSISTVEQLLNGENNGENWTASRPHDNNSSRGCMDYDPDSDRVYILRPEWDVCNTWSMEPGWTSMNSSDWNSKGGTGGSNLGMGVVHNGRYIGTANDHDQNTRGKAWVVVGSGSKVTLQSTRDANSYGGFPAYHPGLDRYFINGWFCDGPPENAGTSMSNWTSWTTGITAQGDARSITNLFYSSQLDEMIAVGSIRVNAGEKSQYCHWTSPDGVTWSDFILTNPVTQEEGYWSFGLDAPQVASHLLCSAGGNVAGKRFGVSQTLGTTQSLPELTFASTAGLDKFAVGDEVIQSDLNVEGFIARIANGRMVINGTPAGQTWGPANTGLWVVGPEETFDPAWAEIDADGNVTRLLPFDPGYELMNGTGPWNITFPAVFQNGTVPDDVIPPGSSIRADLAAVSNADGFIASDEAQSNVVIPT